MPRPQVASLSNLATVYDAMGQSERAKAMQSLVAQMKRTWEDKQKKKRYCRHFTAI